MEREAKNTGAAGTDPEVTLCRFVKDPFPECYCMNITGRKIGKMLAFCSADYRSCSVYRDKIETAAPSPSRR